MGRCRPVIDEAIHAFPDFANFYEMCPEFMKPQEIRGWRRLVGQ